MTTPNENQAEKQGHSPTPWKISPPYWTPKIQNGRYFCQVLNEQDIVVCNGWGATKEEAEANAARIVACVNFCAGLDDKELAMSKDKAKGWLTSAGREENNLCRQLSDCAAELATLRQEKEKHLRHELAPNPICECPVCHVHRRREKAEALVSSYDRQDELIGTEFEGVDEVTDVIRLLKQERDQYKAAWEWVKRLLTRYNYDELSQKLPPDLFIELHAILTKTP